MYYPSRSLVRQFKQKNSLTPIKKDIDASAKPLELYRYVKPLGGGMSFLLESCRTHQKTGRFSFLAAEPFLIFRSKAGRIQITEGGRTAISEGDPVRSLRFLLNKYRSIKVPGIDGFTGGAVGYFAYDCRHLFERLPALAKDDLGLPDIFLMFVDTVVVFDHLENKLAIVSNIYPDKPFDEAYDEAVENKPFDEAYDEAVGKIERLEERLAVSGERLAENGLRKPQTANRKPNYQSTFTKQGFEDVVRRVKKYIAAGDIYQANLSQRFSVDIGAADTLQLYERLSEINPSPFACYLDLEGLKIVSSSPERLLKLEDGMVQTRPIAGTRPRGKTRLEDLALSCELILSEKERAEHIMLVDLERNDLGRVCEYGSVKVDELMALEDYSHVIHIVSNVAGRLKKGRDMFDLLAAAFPGGTITGCPKIRCMQIIDELEPVARNIYTGSIGYLGFNQDMDLNIAIRTLVIKGAKAYLQVGAGIVADSDPQKEYYETLYKAQALLEALEDTDEKSYAAQCKSF